MHSSSEAGLPIPTAEETHQRLAVGMKLDISAEAQKIYMMLLILALQCYKGAKLGPLEHQITD